MLQLSIEEYQIVRNAKLKKELGCVGYCDLANAVIVKTFRHLMMAMKCLNKVKVTMALTSPVLTDYPGLRFDNVRCCLESGGCGVKLVPLETSDLRAGGNYDRDCAFSDT